MSQVLLSSEMEGLYGVLYELVRPMLASDDCVKCITQDGTAIFTSDVEHLLSNLDIEHPAGELVIQALKSHKHVYGTGTKTLLFMIASLAKAVTQLHKLGIPSEESLNVMRKIITDLSKDIQEISVKTKHYPHPHSLRKFSTQENEPSSAAHSSLVRSRTSRFQNSGNELEITPRENLDSDNLIKPVLQIYNDKPVKVHPEYIPISKKAKWEEEPGISYHSLTREIEMSSLPSCQLTPTDCVTSEENHERMARSTDLKLMSRYEHGDSEVIYQSHDCAHEFSGREGQEGIQNSNDEESLNILVSASADPVHLKMSNLQDYDRSANDVSWFFDTISSHPEHTLRTENTPTVDQVDCSVGEFPSCCSDYSLCGDHQQSQTQNVDSHYNDLYVVDMLLSSGWNKGKKSCGSESSLKNLNDEHYKEEVLGEVEVSSFKDGDQHSLDFEDCFDDIENRKHFHLVVEPIPADDTLEKDVLFPWQFSKKLSETKNVDPNTAMINNVKKHYFSDVDFDEDSEPLLFHDQPPRQDITLDEEFGDCFSEICEPDAVIARDSKLEASSKDSIQQPSLYLSGVLNEKKQKTCSPPVEFSEVHKETMVNDNISTSDKISSENEETVSKFCEFDEKSSKCRSQRSEIEMLNSMLSFLGADKSHLDLSTSSRHLKCPQSRNLHQSGPQKNFTSQMHENNNTRDTCSYEQNSSHIENDIHNCQRGKEIVLEYVGDNYGSCTPPLDISNIWHGCANSSVVEAVESNLPQNSSKKRSGNKCQRNKKNMSSSTSNSDLEEHESCKMVSNKNKNDKDKKDMERLLDQLLLQKTTQLRSSLAAGLKTSSRHFRNTSRSNVCLPLQEDYRHPNMDGCSLPCQISDIYNNLNSYVDNSHEGQQFSDLVENHLGSKSAFVSPKSESSSSKSTSTGLKSESSLKHNCSSTQVSYMTTDVKHLTDVASSLSGEVVPFCHILKPCEIVCALHDCHGEMADIALHIFKNQVKGKEETRFNINYVECLSVPPSMISSLPSACKPSWRFSTSSACIVQGLVIPCDTDILERLGTDGTPLATLLINADLTPNFHHKGYKPTLHRRTLISRPHGQTQASEERKWCSNVLSIINQLNVKLVLVKGSASSYLMDMCQGAGLLVLTNVRHHTLNILCQIHKVDMLTYLTLATEANLCSLCLQPMSDAWMDCLEKAHAAEKHFLVVTNVPDIQTAILHCSSTMSAQLYEERLWRCLHSIANSQADAEVLPGGGSTEIWCAGRVREKSAEVLASQSYMQSVILDAIAHIFEDYHKTVKQNTIHETNQPTSQTITESTMLAAELGLTKDLLSLASASEFGLLDHKFQAGPNFNKDQESPISSNSHECLRSSCNSNISERSTQAENICVCRCTCYRQKSGLVQPEATDETGRSQSSGMLGTELWMSHNPCECQVYDNFRSKISAWVTAIDIVSILQSLGSLVTTGIDSADVTVDMVLL